MSEKGLDLGPPMTTMTPMRLALAQQRHGQHGPDRRTWPPALDTARELRLGRQDVLDVDRPPVEHRPAADVAATERGAVLLRSPVRLGSDP